MKKVSIVTLKTLESESLESLRELGVLHVFADRVESDRGERLREEQAAIDRALTTIPESEDGDGEPELDGDRAVDRALEIADTVQQLADEFSQLNDEADRLERERERFASWGGVDPHRIAELAEAGVNIGLYEVTPDDAEDLLAALPQAMVLTRSKTVVRILGVASGADHLPAGPEPMSLPAHSDAEAAQRLSEIAARRAEVEAAIAAYAPQRPLLHAAQARIDQALEFVRVQASMDSEKELSWITGFLPHDRVDTVRDAASREGWGLVVQDPAPDEHVPTQVRNPKPVGIVKPVFDLLGTVPGYREIDISLPFLLFFIVFFAMIIGDGGYGAILLVGTLVAMIRGRAKGARPGPGTVLMLVLSSATVVWGAITGNWFGYAEFAELPVLRDLVVPAISAQNETTSRQTIQYMTFVIGTVHLALAHLWNFVRGLRARPFLAAFEQLGWLLMVLGLYYLVLELVLGSVAMSIVPRPSWWLNMVIVGFGFVIVFGQQQQGQNFFVGVGKGVANIITTALDGISAFSDIISYIRLFAVGLASLAIAEAFNQMAGGIADSMGGVGGAVAAALVLFLGHTLNLAMGALSVIVHGVRLNMLEFSQHLGMEWTGVEYAPFKTRS